MALDAKVMGAMPSRADTGASGNNLRAHSNHPNADGRPPRIPYPKAAYEMIELLRKCIENQASDLHLAVGRPPVIRINGTLRDIDGDDLSPVEARRLIYGVLNDAEKQKFEEEKELDFSLAVSNLGRFRANIHLQRGTLAAAFRAIDSVIRNFK